MVRVTAYGGIGEIGGNKILVEDGDRRLMLDFGMSFSAHGSYFAEFLKPRSNSGLRDLLRLGVLPDLDGVYRRDCCRQDGVDALASEHGFRDLWEAPVQSYDDYVREHGRPFVDAVVLTHAHMDHFGHFGYLDPKIPIYGTPVTIEALKAISRISGRGLEGEWVEGKTRTVVEQKSGMFEGAERWRGTEPFQRPLNPLTPYETTRVGPFTVTLIPVDHSIPGAASVLVEVGGKRIYYSGDVRFHGLFKDATARLWKAVDGLEPDLFVCEGTRMDSDEGDHEDKVRARITRDVKASTGLAMVDFGWKDTTRFTTLQRVAEATGRTLVINHKLAYLLKKLHEAAPARFHPVEAYPNVRVYIRRKRSMRYERADYKRPVELGYWDGTWSTAPEGDPEATIHWDGGATAADIRKDPSGAILMLSQYEMQDLIDLEPPKGSVYLRAACEPFSDEMDLDLQRQARWLQAFGIPVNESPEESDGPLPVSIHASGHACRKHIRDFVRRVAPKQLLPIHTVHPDRFDGLGTDVAPWSAGSRDPVTVEL